MTHLLESGKTQEKETLINPKYNQLFIINLRNDDFDEYDFNQGNANNCLIQSLIL